MIDPTTETVRLTDAEREALDAAYDQCEDVASLDPLTTLVKRIVADRLAEVERQCAERLGMTASAREVLRIIVSEVRRG